MSNLDPPDDLMTKSLTIGIRKQLVTQGRTIQRTDRQMNRHTLIWRCEDASKNSRFLIKHTSDDCPLGMLLALKQFKPKICTALKKWMWVGKNVNGANGVTVINRKPTLPPHTPTTTFLMGTSIF